MKRTLAILGAVFFWLGSTCFLVSTLMPDRAP